MRDLIGYTLVSATVGVAAGFVSLTAFLLAANMGLTACALCKERYL